MSTGKWLGVIPGSGVDDIGGSIVISLLGGCLFAMLVITSVTGLIAWLIHHYLHWF